MSKVVTVEELKAHAEELVEEVRRGETLTLVQNGESVATMAPLSDAIQYVHVPPPGVRPSDFTPTYPLSKPLPDAARIISEDRDGEWEKNGVS